MVGDFISREAALTVLDWDCASQDALNAIKAIPAADVVEIRHASWIEDGYYNEPCVCSYCGEPGNPEWRFCPNCGAECKGGHEPPKEEADNFCADCHWYEAEEMYCRKQGNHSYNAANCVLWEPKAEPPKEVEQK